MTLFDAIKNRDLEAVHEGIDAGDDVNARDDSGETALMKAARAGLGEVVTALLAAGAEPTLTDNIGETALQKAAAHAQLDAMKALWPSASPEAQDEAEAFFLASGRTDGPDDGEAQARTLREMFERFKKNLKQSVAAPAARASELIGDKNPQRRVERVERAKKR